MDAAIDQHMAQYRRIASGAGQAECDQQQSHGDQRSADEIQPSSGFRLIGRDFPEQQRQRDAAERQVDGKHQPPAPVADRGEDEPTNHRAENRGERRERRPQPDGLAALLAWVGLGDDGEAARDHQRRPEPLHGARADQERRVGGDRADQ